MLNSLQNSFTTDVLDFLDGDKVHVKVDEHWNIWRRESNSWMTLSRVMISFYTSHYDLRPLHTESVSWNFCNLIKNLAHKAYLIFLNSPWRLAEWDEILRSCQSAVLIWFICSIKTCSHIRPVHLMWLWAQIWSPSFGLKSTEKVFKD